MKSVKASDFKARCLKILDEVQRTGETVVISKRGRIVAELVPPRSRGHTRYPQQTLRGTGRTLGDIVSPALPPEAWEAARGRGRRFTAIPLIESSSPRHACTVPHC